MALLPPDLIGIIKQVLASWQVWVAAAAFILFRALVNAAASNKAPKKRGDQSVKKSGKVKRPPKIKEELPKDVNTYDLNLGK